jgi:catechol 2,3-dioxygenase-like lactoylglutathione lyase family enzyme
MLTNSKAFSGFAVDDVAKAAAFYGDTLGLRTSEQNGMLTLHLAADRDVGDRQRVARGLRVLDEDVQLGLLAASDARGGGDVHARVADRGGDLRERARRILDVDDEVDRHGPRRQPNRRGRRRFSADAPDAQSSSTDRMLPAGSVNHAIGGP